MVYCRIVVPLLFLGAAALRAQPANLILSHGKIVTADPQFRIADSIAMRGDRILAVGDRAAVAHVAGPGTRQFDLQGKTVLPGLIDSHVHAAQAAMYEFDHPVPDMETIADVLRYIEWRAAVAKAGDWIVLTQVFITRLREQRFPTRAELDAAAPHNPVYFGTGPDAAVNSLALELSGIGRDFRIADGMPGRIERDATGEPTGILRNCSRLVKIHSGGRNCAGCRSAHRWRRVRCGPAIGDAEIAADAAEFEREGIQAASGPVPKYTGLCGAAASSSARVGKRCSRRRVMKTA